MRKRSFIGIVLAAALALGTISVAGSPAGAQKNAKIDPSARLVYGMNMSGGGFSQRLQPDKMTAICDAVVGNSVFGTLIRRDTKTNQPVPHLAESWKVVDPSTFEFKLRPNQTFHDGTKLDAAAAKRALDVSRAGDSKLFPTLGVISSVEAGAVHVVEPGDTYWSIAGALDTDGDITGTVDALSAANGGRALQVGDRLLLPG